MDASWTVAEALLAYPQLADLLGERHQIIGNNWRNRNGFPAEADDTRRQRAQRMNPAAEPLSGRDSRRRPLRHAARATGSQDQLTSRRWC